MQHILADYILNAAWQVPIVALCALILSRFGGLSPHRRNQLWVAFLLTAATLPMVSLDVRLPHLAPNVARAPAGLPMASQALAPLHAPLSNDPAVLLPTWSVWAMTSLFLVLALTLLLRLAMAAIAADRLVRRSEHCTLPVDLAKALEAMARAHRRRSPEVRRSHQILSPAVVGAFRPVILIPDAMALQGDDLRAALLHEMAHIVRGDYAINLACELLALPICWHPAHLGIKSGFRRSRELACDDIAAAAMASPKAYARCLVSLARTLSTSSSSRPTLALAVGLFGRSDLEERLMHLTQPQDIEIPVIRVARICGLAGVGASLIGSAALLHVTPVFAQASNPVATSPSPPVASAPLESARDDAAAEPPAPRHRGGLIVSKKGVAIETRAPVYRHSFTGADGRTLSVTTDTPDFPSPEDLRRWEDQAQKAEAKAADVEKMVNSPEFKQQIERAEASAAEVRKLVNSPEFQARIQRAAARAAEAQNIVNSPELKATIAKAQASAAAAQDVVNSAEFKAMIAKFQTEMER